MNIWIVNHYAVPRSRAGITRHFSLARHMLKHGHNVSIIASSFDHVSRKEHVLQRGEDSRLEVVDGVPFLWIRTPEYTGNNWSRSWNMLAFACRLWWGRATAGLSKPDLVVGSSPHLFAAFSAERLAARQGVPFILEVRDLWPQSLIDLGGVSHRHPLVRILEKLESHLYRKAARIITLLPGAVEYIRSKTSKTKKIEWLPNGVEVDEFTFDPPERVGDKLVFLYAGAHGLANGLDVLLDAAAILRAEEFDQIQFVLVGDGPDKPRLIARVKTEGLENVKFLDPVPKTQMPDVLRRADACLMVLKNSPVFRWGVSPNKLFDYLASARPVIYAVDSEYNLVEEAGAGFSCESGNPSALAECVKRMALLPLERRLAMGVNGRNWVTEKYDYDHLAARLEEILIETLACK